MAQSTMEAEPIASATAMRAVNWMTGFLSEIGIDKFGSGTSVSPLLSNDNQACVTMLTSGNFKSDNRELRVRYYAIYEPNTCGILAIEHIAGDEMLADALTKPLDDTKNCVFNSRLGMVLIVPFPVWGFPVWGFSFYFFRSGFSGFILIYFFKDIRVMGEC